MAGRKRPIEGSIQCLFKSCPIWMRTFPNIFKGRPRYERRLFLSLVRRDVARDSEVARELSGGEPQSSRFCNKPKQTN